MIWMKDLLLAFGGSEQTIPYAQDYLNIVVPGTLLTSLSFGFNAVMRASGYPKKAMFTMLIGAITNVILDPIFIFWLDMGIKGAAIANDHLDAALYSFCHEPFCPKRQYRPFP